MDFCRLGIVCALLLFVSGFSGIAGAVELAAKLNAARAKAGTPAMGAVIVRDGAVVDLAVTGVRARGSDVAVTTDDRWHLGSNLKAMTATLVARHVAAGQLSFDATLPELFPDVETNPAFRDVTIAQLLAHTSGLRANLTHWEMNAQGDRSPAPPRVEARAQLAERYLGLQPAYEPGTEFRYSNLGYLVVGAALEGLTGAPFETQMATRVFEPLGIETAGWGAPGEKGRMDQPRGHRVGLMGIALLGGGVMEPGTDRSDNPPIMAPAGTVHMSLQDYARFLIAHLGGPEGESALLPADLFRTLQEPYPGTGGGYALGWVVTEDAESGLTFLQHAGSNTMWYAVARLIPQRDTAVALSANAADEKTKKALRNLMVALTQEMIAEPTD